MLRGMQWSGWRAVLAMSTALVLAGCAQTASPPVRSSTPIPTKTPRSTSIAESAEGQYRLYFKVSTDVLRDGGERPERIRPYVTSTQYDEEVAFASTVRKTKRHLVGATSSRNFTVQSISADKSRLTAYVCVDNEKSEIVDQAGRDVTPAGRVARSTLLLTFDTSGARPLLAKSQQWSGNSVC
jgi:hypothetical protein